MNVKVCDICHKVIKKKEDKQDFDLGVTIGYAYTWHSYALCQECGQPFKQLLVSKGLEVGPSSREELLAYKKDDEA